MSSATGSRVSMLDGFAVRLGGSAGGTVEGLPRGAQRLVAHLSLTGRPARTAIAGQLWPDVPEDHAHGSLRSALWRLQKVAPGLVQARGDALSLAPDVRVDVRELADWADRVRDPRTPVEDLRAIDVAGAGELLPGWYDDWVLLEREWLRQLRMHALEVVADRLATAGRHCEALQAAYAAVRAEPLRESAHRTVVRAHLAEGNVAEALRAHDVFAELLDTELGVAPTRQMAALVAHLRPPRR